MTHSATYVDQEIYDRTVLGFWVYLMTDCVLFGTLFSVYAVLHNNTFGGPTSKDLFDLPSALAETLILLTSTFTCGLSILAAQNKNSSKVLLALAATFILGASFVGLELNEFTDFVKEGHSWKKSAFLSSFFTLVGTHGFHVSCGLLWILFLCWQIFSRGLVPDTIRRLTCFSMFWHFLDVIWIFIFTLVYLMGVM